MTTSISIKRRLQWMDTDAAGVWHHSTVLRWTEEAEVELHRELGIVDQTFGAIPRVHVEFDFRESLRFDDDVKVNLEVAKVGDSSVTYAIEVRHGDEPVASGRMVAVMIDRVTGRKVSWPDHIRRALEGR